MLETAANFRSKDAEIAAQDCVIEKVIRLSGAEFDSFSHNLLRDQDFITENRDLMFYDENRRRHCLLVVGDDRRDGILVDASGYDYARYTALLPNAEDFLTMSQYPALVELNRKLTTIVDAIAEQGGAGSPDGRGIVNLQDWEDLYDIDLMTNNTLRSTMLSMLNERPEIRDWELDGGQLIVYRDLGSDESIIETPDDVPAAVGSVTSLFEGEDTGFFAPVEGSDLFPDNAAALLPENTGRTDLQDLSDPTVTRTDMYAYGYTWDGMIPLGKDKALELFDAGHGIYRLYEDDAEGLVDSREEIFEFDGLFGTEDPAWVRPGREQPIEVFAYNPVRQAAADISSRISGGDGSVGDGRSGSFDDAASGGIGSRAAHSENTAPNPAGEWLTLPVGAESLQGLFEDIGVDGADSSGFVVVAVRVPDYLTEYVTKNDSLDELNMLASYMNYMEDFELDKLQAILESGVADIERSAAGIINLICSENFDAFVMIDAKDYDALGKYYEEHKPDGVSFEEFGRQNADEDKGVFINDSYIYHRHKEITQEYDGVVPDEYKIVDAALGGLQAKQEAERSSGKGAELDSDSTPGKKPSVLQQIFAARKSSKKTKGKAETAKGKEAPDTKKHKGGPDL